MKRKKKSNQEKKNFFFSFKRRKMFFSHFCSWIKSDRWCWMVGWLVGWTIIDKSGCCWQWTKQVVCRRHWWRNSSDYNTDKFMSPMHCHKKLTIDGDLLQLANLYQPRISDRQHQSIGAVGAGIVSPTSPTHDQALSSCSKFRKSEPRNFTDCVTNSGRTSLGSGFSRACLVRPSFIRL